MGKLPIRAKQFSTADFLAWLASNGAEVCNVTNPYELVRYRAYTSGATKALTHIVYRKDNGLLTWTGASMKHYQAFLDGGELIGAKPYGQQPSPVAVEATETLSQGDKRRHKLMDRDGSDCWFCGDEMGDDCTLEHLVPRSRGGGNTMANLVLAHAECNGRAADLSISEKVELRTRLRARTPEAHSREEG